MSTKSNCGNPLLSSIPGQSNDQQKAQTEQNANRIPALNQPIRSNDTAGTMFGPAASYVYLINNENRLSTSEHPTFTELRTAYANLVMANVNAGRIAHEHANAGVGATQIQGYTYPDHQTFWKTTYLDGSWRRVGVEKVLFVGDLSRIQSLPNRDPIIYLVKNAYHWSGPAAFTTFEECYAAYANQVTAYFNAERVAYEHKHYKGDGATQTEGETFPDRQAFWKTTYPNGTWRQVNIHQVQLVVGGVPQPRAAS